ncbi:MAG: Fur family transcriptional regulator [Microthrixaceae bacterium]
MTSPGSCSSGTRASRTKAARGRSEGAAGPLEAGAAHHAATEMMDAADLRYTASRRAIVETLARLDGPRSSQELLAADRSMPQSSLYRNLAVLEGAGVVKRVTTHEGFARFELTEEVSGHHHHHLVCRGCGEVSDVELPAELESAIDHSADRIGDRHRFEVSHHQLDLVGWCERCRVPT